MTFWLEHELKNIIAGRQRSPRGNLGCLSNSRKCDREFPWSLKRRDRFFSGGVCWFYIAPWARTAFSLSDHIRNTRVSERQISARRIAKRSHRASTIAINRRSSLRLLLLPPVAPDYTRTHVQLVLAPSFVYSLYHPFAYSFTHSVHSHIRWLPDENSSSASHVASEGCLRDREVSPRRSVRREREDRDAIGWKRRRDSEIRRKRERAWDRGARERRYWIGDTAWEVSGSSLL